MSIALDFFRHELTRLRHNSIRLKSGLDHYPLDDPRGEGQLALLETQLENYRLVIALLPHATSPAEALAAIRHRYLKAARMHERSRWDRNARELCQSDPWWRTLGQMQYLAHLYDRLQARLDRHAPEDIRRENGQKGQQPPPTAAIQAATRDMEVLQAVVKAHDRALSAAYLVRDHIETRYDEES